MFEVQWCGTKKRAADRNRQMKVHENEPVTSTAVALSLITCWTQSCPTGSLTSLQRFAWSQPVRWAQSNQYREWNLNFVLLSLPSLSFQLLTFACFLAFLFFLRLLARPRGETVLWPAEECRVSEWSRSGTNQDRSVEGKAGERERENSESWMGFTKSVKGGEDGEKETVRGGTC